MKKTILVIEDERSTRTNLLKCLEADGFNPIGAENGFIGIELAKKHRPDLIICDILMPELDGYDVLTKLQQEEITAAIPFIFLTAKADIAGLRKSMEMGADDYLSKPVTRVELLSVITSQLQKQKAARFKCSTESIQDLEESILKIRKLQEFIETKDELLNSLCEGLPPLITNINTAIRELKEATIQTKRDHYLEFIQKEFASIIALVNQVSELQHFLKPENAQIIRQFNFLHKKTKENRNS
ncbi:MAG: response regulator [Symploca sp. SIO3C6]|nr:response regulator [Symploca sp. SIO3C6]NET07914.1 response regulator [Symploca sp. SIO2B6]